MFPSHNNDYCFPSLFAMRLIFLIFFLRLGLQHVMYIVISLTIKIGSHAHFKHISLIQGHLPALA